MRPTALALNVLVASFTSFRYLRAGLFRWRTLWPFLLGAMPFAFLGGAIQLPGAYYRPLVGVILLLSGARLLWPRGAAIQSRAARPADMGRHSLRRRPSASYRASPARGRNLPLPDLAVSRLVRHAHRLRRRGGVHPLQFDRGLARQPRHRQGAAAQPLALCRCRDARAIVGTTFGVRWQPPMNSQSTRLRAHYRGPQADRSLLAPLTTMGRA